MIEPVSDLSDKGPGQAYALGKLYTMGRYFGVDGFCDAVLKKLDAPFMKPLYNNPKLFFEVVGIVYGYGYEDERFRSWFKEKIRAVVPGARREDAESAVEAVIAEGPRNMALDLWQAHRDITLELNRALGYTKSKCLLLS